MVDLMGTPIGESGFELCGSSANRKRQKIYNASVKNIETGKTLFSLTGKGTFFGRKFSRSPGTTSSKKFLGFDDRWYYVRVTGGGAEWGKITSSGAVVKADRTMLTSLNFYPIYKEKPLPPPPSPKTPITILPKPYTPKKTIKKTVKQEDSWYKKIIQIIENLINQIKNLLKA